MYIQTWKKYLPVIHILIKRSVQGEQVLDMNQIDFERAAGGKKVRLGFETLVFGKGKGTQAAISNALSRDLLLVLQEHYSSRSHFEEARLQLSMDNKCRLTIRRQPPDEADSEDENSGRPLSAHDDDPSDS